MSRMRKVNSPLEVYVIEDCIYQVLEKPPGEGEMWMVAMASPRERETRPQEIYAQTLVASGRLVWSQGDGELPAKYRI